MSDKLQTKFNELLKIVLDDIRYKTVNHTYNIKDGVLENRQEINTILVNVGIYIKYMTSKLDIYKDVEVSLIMQHYMMFLEDILEMYGDIKE